MRFVHDASDRGGEQGLWGLGQHEVGFGHWEVTVVAGEVTLIGEESDSVQRHTTQLIAGAVIGVTAVRFADPAIAG
ncbi:MAG: hypothetical protein DLM60_23545 [Pseudonocardiales bacterium]|nr:BON domain-containing protein [Actinomycetota bacterium]PZS11784.1 MAG: hypothetical protein DLM60_23545 [Pseudonocardiales bacterium]